ncbi:MAG: peptidase [Proteobacteria bacterium]|nr:peptidase [Pseudomonadota bacterium]
MRCLAIPVLLLVAITSQAVERFCADDAIGRKLLCVEQNSRDNATRVEFHVTNGYDFPVTVSFEPLFTNMATDVSFPLIMTVPGGVRNRVYEAWRINPAARNTWRNNWVMRFGANEPNHDDTYRYRAPFQEGKNFRLIQGYGGSDSHQGEFHYSLDWDMPIGTPIHAARAGKVIHALDRFSGRAWDPSYKERTNTITILHADGTMAEYSHIGTGTLHVRLGQQVQEGDLLALSSDVGYSGGPHLHFRVFRLVRGTEYESLPIRFRDARIKTQ